MDTTGTTRYLIERCWAGRCTYGGRDAVWAGALVKEDGEAARSGESDQAAIWHYLAAYGKTGSNLNGGKLSSLPTSRKDAEALFEKMVKEKAGPHHYVQIDFAPFVASFKVPLVLSPEAGGDASTSAQDAPFRYAACSVVPFSWEKCLACLTSPLYGASEKVNGERCLVEFDGVETLIAYNRLGKPMTVPPEAAQYLRGLDHPLVVDGERLMGEQAGQYVIFDLLEINGADVRDWPYQQRVSALQQAMFDAGLLQDLLTTPTYERALANSVVPGLALLVSEPGGVRGPDLVEDLRQQKREGVVVRQLAAGYIQTRAAQKFKFLAEMDVVVIGFEPGSSEGSVRLGLVRPSDGAVIEIGNVRAGLSDADIRVLRDMRANGQWPVLTVEYLPIRTVGITLVETRVIVDARARSKSSAGASSQDRAARLRSDKRAQDCTTDQFREHFGTEKDTLIQDAEGLDLILS